MRARAASDQAMRHRESSATRLPHPSHHASGELDVRYALEGTLRKEGTCIRINAQLVDCRTGANLWARRFEGDLTKGFELQDRLSGGVVGEVVAKLEQAEMDLHRRASL